MPFSRIIPEWKILNNSKQPLTEGEKHIIKFLDNTLPKDELFNTDDLATYNGWLIFVQPYLNGTRPDIILFHPYRGIQIIEVKDWNLKNYSSQRTNDNRVQYYVHDKRGEYQIKSPLLQAKFYRTKLIGELVPQIGEYLDRIEQVLVCYSVYFHNANTEEAKNFIKSSESIYKYHPVFGFDSLKKESLSDIVPELKYKYSKWDKSFNKEILFWLIPPFHSLEQTIKIDLTPEQKIAAIPQKGHHRIRGIAGSGKTLVMAYRAGKLASEGKKVLVLTFNITLWHYIRDMIQRSPFEFSWSQITFDHFHGFCKTYLNNLGISLPQGKVDLHEYFKTIIPNIVNSFIDKITEQDKYDAILIDEGQDYFMEWYLMLCYFLTNNDEILVLCDKRQNIYSRNTEWLDRRRTEVKKFGDWYELKNNLRLPVKIFEQTNKFSEQFNLNQDVKLNNKYSTGQLNFEKEHFLWWNSDPIKWIDRIFEAFDLIKQKADYKHNSDIAILLPDSVLGYQCVEHFHLRKNLYVNHVFEKENEKKLHTHKRAFWMGDGKLKLSTIHSFKGWEVKNVILYINRNDMVADEILDKIVYTAMTRTKQNLIVINSNERYFEFSKNILKEWIDS